MLPSDKQFRYEDIDNLLRGEEAELKSAQTTLDYQKYLAQSAERINPYSIPAYGNINQVDPTLATSTYNPAAHMKPVDLTTEQGQQQAIFNIFHKDTEPEAYVLPTVTSNYRDVNFDRYYNHPAYNKLKFHPYLDNETIYNENSTWWDDASRMMGQFASLTKTGFYSAYRSLGDLFDDDSYFGGKDLDSAREFAEAMRIGNSTRGGLGGFLNNTILNAGYTFGIIGSIAMEEFALMALRGITGGLATPLTVGRTAKNLERLGDAADTLDALKDANNATEAANISRTLINELDNPEVAKTFYERFKAGENMFTRIFTPETTKALQTLNTAKNTGQNITNMAKLAPFGGFYRDLRSLNFALSEGKMEAGMAYDEVMAEGLKIYSEEEGLTQENIANTVDMASRAAFYTTLANVPIIYFSNQIVLGNAFGSFNRSLAQVFNDNVSLAAKRIRKVKKNFADGAITKDVFVDVGEGIGSLYNRFKAVGVKGTFKGTAAAALRYFAENLTEGAQELVQEAITHGTVHYYTSLIKDPAANLINLRNASIASAVNAQFSAEGFEAFMSGFLMGGIVQGPQKILFQGIPNLGQRIFTPEKYEKHRKQRQEYIDGLVKSYNELHNNLGTRPDFFNLSPDNLNYVLQKQVSEDQLDAIDGNSTLDFIDNKDESRFFNIYALAETGGLDYFREFFNDLKKLSAEDMASAVPSLSEDIKNGKAMERIDSYLANIDKVEKDYNNSKNKLLNPYNPKLYETGTPEHTLESFRYRAFEHFRFLTLFTGDGIRRAAERKLSLFQTLESEPLFDKMGASDLTVLTSNESVLREIRLLNEEVKTLDAKDAEQKERIEFNQKKVEKLSAIYDLMETKKKTNGTFDWRSRNAMLKAFTGYVQLLAKSNDSFVNNQNVIGILQKIMDYHQLDRRQELYNNALNFMLDPEGMADIVRAQTEIGLEAYKNVKLLKESIEAGVTKKEQSDLITQLNKMGVHLDEQELTTFTDSNDTTALNKFYDNNGDLITDPELIKDIERQLRKYDESTKSVEDISKEFEESIDTEELENQVKNALTQSPFIDEVVERLKKSGESKASFLKTQTGRDLIEAYKIIKRYQWEKMPPSPTKLLEWQEDIGIQDFIKENADELADLIAIFNFEVQDFLVEALYDNILETNKKKIQENKKEREETNQRRAEKKGQEIVDTDALAIDSAQEFDDQQDDDAILDQYVDEQQKAQESTDQVLNDQTENKEVVEEEEDIDGMLLDAEVDQANVREEEGEQADDEIEIDKDLSDKGFKVIAVRVNNQVRYLAKYNDTPINEVKAFYKFDLKASFEKPLDAENQIKRLLELVNQLNKKQITITARKKVKYGTVYKAQDGTPYRIVGKSGKTFLLVNENDFKDNILFEEYRQQNKLVKFKKLDLARLKDKTTSKKERKSSGTSSQKKKKVDDNLTRIETFEFVQAYPNRDLTKEEYEKIISFLTPEEIQNLEVQIKVNKRTYKKQLKIDNNDPNQHVYDVTEPFFVGIMLPRSAFDKQKRPELFNLLQKLTDTGKPFDPTQPFAFVNTGQNLITDAQGDPIDLDQFTDDELADIFIGYTPNKRDQVIKNFYIQKLLQEKLQSMGVSGTVKMKLSDLEGFTLQVPEYLSVYPKEEEQVEKSFLELEKNTFTYQGDEYFVLISKEFGSELSRIRVFDKDGNSAGSRVQAGIQAILRKKADNRMSSAASKQSLSAVINLPNGSIRFMSIVSSKLSDEEIAEVSKDILDRAILTTEKNVTKSNVPGKKDEIKEVVKNAEWNQENIKEKIFITSGIKNLHFNILVLNNGSIMVEASKRTTKVVEGKSQFVYKNTKLYTNNDIEALRKMDPKAFFDMIFNALNPIITDKTKLYKNLGIKIAEDKAAPAPLTKNNIRHSTKRFRTVKGSILEYLADYSTKAESAFYNQVLHLSLDNRVLTDTLQTKGIIETAAVSEEVGANNDTPKTTTPEPKVVLDLRKQAVAIEQGFQTWEHVVHSLNKRRAERNLEPLPVSIKTFNGLADSVIIKLGQLSESATEIRTKGQGQVEEKKITQNELSGIVQDKESKKDALLKEKDALQKEIEAIDKLYKNTTDNNKKLAYTKRRNDIKDKIHEINKSIKRADAPLEFLIPDELKDVVVPVDINGRAMTIFYNEVIDRVITFVKIDDKIYGFYRSSAGTDGKEAGNWYPFYGIDEWVIKDGFADAAKTKWIYNNQATPELQKKLEQAANKLNNTFWTDVPITDVPYLEGTKRQINKLIGSPAIYGTGYKTNVDKRNELKKQVALKGFDIKEVKVEEKVSPSVSIIETAFQIGYEQTVEKRQLQLPKGTTSADLEMIVSLAKDKRNASTNPVERATLKTYITRLNKYKTKNNSADKILRELVPEGTGESLDDFKLWARKNLPEFIRIEEIETLTDRMRAGGISVGRFVIDVMQAGPDLNFFGTIYTGDKLPSRYHEAFHAVFRLLLDDSQQKVLLSEARKEVRAKLRKEGKSFQTALEEFKELYDPESKLSSKEITDLYYEEYLADQFELFKQNPKKSTTNTKVKSWFTKLIEWIKALFKDFKSSTLTDFYNDIDSGKYATRGNVTNNQFTRSAANGITVAADSLLPYYQSETAKGETEYLYLDAVTSANIIDQITGLIVEEYGKSSNPDVTYNSLISKAINQVSKLYDIKNYERLKDPLDPDYNPDQYDVVFQISDGVFNENRKELQKAVRQRLKAMNISAKNIEDKFEEAEMELGIRNTDQYGKTTEFTGGYRSLPEFVRIYFGTTLVDFAGDAFGNLYFTVESDTEDKKATRHRIKVPIDAAKAYNGFLKATSNTTDPLEVINKLIVFSLENKETEAVVRKFLTDVSTNDKGEVLIDYDKIKEEYDDYMSAVIAGIETDAYDAKVNLNNITNPQLFQIILKSFTNFRLEYMFFHDITEKAKDPSTGKIQNVKKSLIYSASNRDDANYQLDVWADTHRQRFKKLKITLGKNQDGPFKREALDMLDRFELFLEDSTLTDYADIREESELFAKEMYEYLGITLSPLYIQYSYLYNQNLVDVLPSLSVFQNVDESFILTSQGISELADIVSTYGSANQKYLFSDGQLGAKSRLKLLAQGNAEFDENVGASTFLNAEGKIVYGHQLPTFDLIKAAALNSPNVEAAIQKLMESIPENSRKILENNHLLNNEFFRHMMQADMVKITRIAGLKESNSYSEINDPTEISGKSPGTTYGSLKPQQLIKVLIDSYLASVNSNDSKTIKKGKLIKLSSGEEAILAPTLIRILEASNTGDTTFLPVSATVEYDEDNNTRIKDEVKEAFVKNIIAEFNRIQKEANPETRTKEQIVGYNATKVFDKSQNTDQIVDVDPNEGLDDEKSSKGRAFTLNATGRLLEAELVEKQQKQVTAMQGDFLFEALANEKTRHFIIKPGALKGHSTKNEVKSTKIINGVDKKQRITANTKYLGSIKLDRENNMRQYRKHYAYFDMLLLEEVPDDVNQYYEVLSPEGDAFYTDNKALADFLNGKVEKDIYIVVDDISINLKTDRQPVKTLGTQFTFIGDNLIEESFKNIPLSVQTREINYTSQDVTVDRAQTIKDNIDSSDGTVIYGRNPARSDAAKYATSQKKPIITNPDAAALAKFMKDNGIINLNVVGLDSNPSKVELDKIYDSVLSAYEILDDTADDYLTDFYDEYFVDKMSKFENIKRKLEVAAIKNYENVVETIDDFKKILATLDISYEEFLEYIGMRLNADYRNFRQVVDNFEISEKLADPINGIMQKDVGEKAFNLLNLKADRDYNLKQIFFNDYLNKTAIMQIYLGDVALSLKDAVDEIKRARGMNGAIVSSRSNVKNESFGIDFEVEKFDLVTITDRYYEGLNGGRKESTDGQLYLTTKAFRYLWFGIGQLTASQSDLLDKIERGEEISPEDVFGALEETGRYKSGYAKRSEMINAKKLLYFDGETFLKMSGFVLTKQLTSRIDSNGKLVAKENRLGLHNLRERLEYNERNNEKTLSVAAYASASKMMKKKVQNINKMMSANVNVDTNEQFKTEKDLFTAIRAEFFGLQVVNPSNKIEVIDPTQMKVLATAEMPEEKIKDISVTIGNKDYPLSEVKEMYNKAKSDKLKLTFSTKRDLIFDIDTAFNQLNKSISLDKITPELYSFLNYALASLESTGSADNIVSFFDMSKTGTEKYNLNNRIVVDKFMQLILAYFSKKVMSEKTPGNQTTIISDEGIRIFRRVYTVDKNGMPDKHEVIRENEFYNSYSDADIQLNIDAVDGVLRDNPGDDKNLATLKTLVEKSGGKGVIIVDRLRPSLIEYKKTGKDKNGKDIDPNDFNTWESTEKKYTEGLMPSMSKDMYYIFEQVKTPKNIQNQFKEFFLDQYRSVFQDSRIPSNIRFGADGGVSISFIETDDADAQDFGKSEFLSFVDIEIMRSLFLDTYGYGWNSGKKEFFDKKGYEEIYSAVSDMHAVRIPSQDKHSSIFVKMVDFLPIFYGSTGTFAREIITEVSGADFDIDKLYVHMKETFARKGKLVAYGDYNEEGRSEDENLKDGYTHYIRYINTHVKRTGSSYKEAFEKAMFKLPDGTVAFRPQEKMKIGEEEFNNLLTYDQYLNMDFYDDMQFDKDAFMALKMLRMPKTFEEYKAYVKTYEVDPYEAAIDNIALDAKNALLGNNYMTSPDERGNIIAFQPADIAPLTEIFNLFAELMPEWHATKVERNMDPNNLYAQYLAFKNNKEGAANIGAIVRPNVYLSLLGQLGLSINPNSNAALYIDGIDFNKFGVQYEKLAEGDPDSPRRTQYIISALITAMTDNAKERMASKFNLNKSALGIVANMVSLGVPLKTALAFPINPTIEYIYQTSGTGKGFVKAVNDHLDLIDQLFKKIEGDKIVDTASKIRSTNYQLGFDMLVNAVNNNYLKANDTIETALKSLKALSTKEEQENFLKDLMYQTKILKEYLKAYKIQDFTFPIGELTGLTKSLGTSLNELNEKTNAATKLYLNMSQVDFAKQLNKSDSPIIVDTRPIFKPSKNQKEKLFISTYYDVYEEIDKKLLAKVSLMKTPLFESIYNAILENANPYMFSSDKSSIPYDLLSYLTIQAYKNYLQKEDPKGYSTLSNDLLYSSDSSNSIINKVQRLREFTDENGDKPFETSYFLNNFIGLLSLNDIDNMSGQNKLQTNIFARINPMMKFELQNSFKEILESEYDEVRGLGQAIVHYIMVSDGLKLRFNGITGTLLPSSIIEYLDSVQHVMQAFASDKSINKKKIQDLFGDEFETIDDVALKFIEGYFSTTLGAFKRVNRSNPKKSVIGEYIDPSTSEVKVKSFKRRQEVKTKKETKIVDRLKEFIESDDFQKVKDDFFVIDFETSATAENIESENFGLLNLGIKPELRTKNKKTSTVYIPADSLIGGVAMSFYASLNELKAKLGLRSDQKIKDADKTIIVNSSSINTFFLREYKKILDKQDKIDNNFNDEDKLLNIINETFKEEFGIELTSMKSSGAQNKFAPIVRTKIGTVDELYINPGGLDFQAALKLTSAYQFNHKKKGYVSNLNSITKRGFPEKYNIMVSDENPIFEMQLPQYFYYKDETTGQQTLYKLDNDSVKSSAAVNEFSLKRPLRTGYFARYVAVPLMFSPDQVNGFMFDGQKVTYDEIQDENKEKKKSDSSYTDVDGMIIDALYDTNHDDILKVEKTVEIDKDNDDQTAEFEEYDDFYDDDIIDSYVDEQKTSNEEQAVGRHMAVLYNFFNGADMQAMKLKLKDYPGLDFSNEFALAQSIYDAKGDADFDTYWEALKKCIL